MSQNESQDAVVDADKKLLARLRRENEELRRALAATQAKLEALEAKLHHKAELLQNVSHELKNPLSVVYGYSSFLLKQSEECKPEDVQRSLKSIHNNAERLGHLLEELFESSRLSSRKVNLERLPAQACRLVEESIDSFALEARRRGVELLQDPACASTVNVDSKRIHQVFANLISNALKFTPQGGTISIGAEETQGFVRFHVRDTGCGVAPENLPHLFERFYQVSNASQENSGMGLGLDISKGLVELHGGRIWADSSLGAGSTFFFTLPVWPGISAESAA